MRFLRAIAPALSGLAAGLWVLLAGVPASATGLANLAPVKPVMDCASLAGVDISQAVGAKVTIRSATVSAGPSPYCGVKGEIAPHIGQMVLFSGNGDFRSLVEAVQRRGVRVVVVSTMSMAADALRRQADQFIEMKDLQSKIGRDEPEARKQATLRTVTG